MLKLTIDMDILKSSFDCVITALSMLRCSVIPNHICFHNDCWNSMSISKTKQPLFLQWQCTVYSIGVTSHCSVCLKLVQLSVILISKAEICMKHGCQILGSFYFVTCRAVKCNTKHKQGIKKKIKTYNLISTTFKISMHNFTEAAKFLWVFSNSVQIIRTRYCRKQIKDVLLVGATYEEKSLRW